MANVYLGTEIKTKPKIEPEISQEQNKVRMALVGLSLLHSHEKRKKLEEENENEEEEHSILDNISRITRAISPVLLPMISTLGDVEK